MNLIQCADIFDCSELTAAESGDCSVLCHLDKSILYRLFTGYNLSNTDETRMFKIINEYMIPTMRKGYIYFFRLDYNNYSTYFTIIYPEDGNPILIFGYSSIDIKNPVEFLLNIYKKGYFQHGDAYFDIMRSFWMKENYPKLDKYIDFIVTSIINMDNDKLKLLSYTFNKVISKIENIVFEQL